MKPKSNVILVPLLAETLNSCDKKDIAPEDDKTATNGDWIEENMKFYNAVYKFKYQ